MTDLKNQRRLAADLLKCGIHRVRFDDRRLEDIAEAVTRADIRKLIVSKAIIALQKKGTSRGRVRYLKFQKAKGRRRGHGSRKGGQRARSPKKRRWIMIIRPIRERLQSLRSKGLIDRHTYRKFYRLAKGNMFKNKAHLNQHLEMKGIKLKDEKVKREKTLVPKTKKTVEAKGKKERLEKKRAKAAKQKQEAATEEKKVVTHKKEA